MKKLLLPLLLLFLVFRVYSQAPGSLDSTFGTNGVSLTPFLLTGTYGYDIALQSDGKIIAAGNTVYLKYYGAMLRLDTNGILDQTFGNNGKVMTLRHNFSHIAVQTDDKIVGVSNKSTDTISVVRYNSDGIIDSTFGTDGITLISWVSGFSYAMDLALQTDGKIIVGGYGPGLFLLRFNTNGQLDSTFGINGLAITNVGTSFQGVSSIAIQPDGKIIEAGYSNNGIDNFTLLRYNVNGALDSTFGINGIVVTPNYGNYNGDIKSIAIQPDGKIFAAGVSTLQPATLMARYYPNGILDSSFGTNGLINDHYGTPNKVALQPDGKIIFSSVGAFRISRFFSNGTIDNFFGTNGTVYTPLGNYSNTHSIAIQSDNKILVVGESSISSTYYMTVLRYNAGNVTDSAGQITGSSYACQGNNNVTYSIHPIIGADSYNWILPQGFIGSSIDTSISVSINSTAQSGTIKVSGHNNCGNGPASSIYVTVTKAFFYFYPQSEYPYQYNILELSVGAHPLSYYWSWGDGTFDTSPYPSHTYANYGQYPICLTITDSLGCSSTFCDTTDYTYMVNVISTGIADGIGLSNSLSVYPIPANDKINIEFTRPTPPSGIISIYDLFGKEIRKQALLSTKTEIDISTLCKGLYFIKLTTAEGSVVRKFIKE